ncbi:conserved hypothetical protein [Magnetospirillum sp. LM-5]|uniref:hypothetical protein n=1 Tax=Magnetospirillum sp. LM-5 TaxID=2681466 RepID=UPI001383D656|nr:hypothetical protein [Magnetospirillum sp. LM-5]CAA7617680.1 conserved hypothetical protein [Magnetospirillum sp. LM-5]
MLLNLVHLLPDPSGALICPKERLVAIADPCRDGDKPKTIGDVIKQVATVLRQRRPARVVWMGHALPTLVGATGTHKDDLIRLIDTTEWWWISDRTVPADLPGQAGTELKVGGLTLRVGPTSGRLPGEVNAGLSPQASYDGATYPCYVLDGRRLILPAFGPRPDGGCDVMSPPIQSLFRRPFQVLMLAGGRILTRPRPRLDGAKPATSGGGGRRLSLFGETEP